MNLESITNLLKNKVKIYKNIVLFVHEVPDCDAIGSTYALQQFLKLNFPNLDVRIAGTTKEVLSKLPRFFNVNQLPVDEEFCHSSLGIICDTANSERILSQLHNECKELVRIDHHIKIETIGQYEWVDDTKSSTCEMVGLILRTWNLKVNETVLQSLYFGLLTDTNRFLYPSTSELTFSLMTWMMSFNFNREVVHDELYLKSFDDALKDHELFNRVKVYEAGYATLFLSKDEVEQDFLDFNLANKVYLMAGFNEIKIWVYVYYDFDLKVYKGSIRSRTYPVNLIANKFGGGGHKLASGFKLQTFEQVNEVEQEIKKMLKGE